MGMEGCKIAPDARYVVLDLQRKMRSTSPGLVYIFNNRVVVGAIITQTINGLLTVVQVFYLPTFYQMAYGYSPVKSGAMILPLTIVQSTAPPGFLNNFH